MHLYANVSSDLQFASWSDMWRIVALSRGQWLLAGGLRMKVGMGDVI